MIEPDFAGAERAPGGEMLLGDDELTVGTPARLVEQAEIFLRQLALVAAVTVHDPDIVAAAAVGDEGDALAIGREARLMLISEPFGDTSGRAARDGHGVDIAEEVEGDRLAVRRDINVHPAAFVDRDRYLVRYHSGRRVDVPFFGFCVGRRRGCLLSENRCRTGQSRGQGECDARHEIIPCCNYAVSIWRSPQSASRRFR